MRWKMHENGGLTIVTLIRSRFAEGPDCVTASEAVLECGARRPSGCGSSGAAPTLAPMIAGTAAHANELVSDECRQTVIGK